MIFVNGACYASGMGDYEPYEVRRFRKSDLKPWLVCALFGAAFGAAAAYNLGDIIDAAGSFVRGADGAQSSRMALSADSLGETQAAAASFRPRYAGPRRTDVFPADALAERLVDAAREPFSGLAPGARLALRARLENAGDPGR